MIFRRILTLITRDTELNEDGLAQAELAGEKFKEYPIDAIYSSDLKRCRATAGAIQKHLISPVDITFTSGLRERCMGPIEGMKIDDAIEYAKKDGKLSYKEYGEGSAALVKRIQNQLNEILEENKHNKNILICSHGGAIRTILRILGFKKDLIVYNTSVTIVDFNTQDFNKFDIIKIGDTKHLGEGEFKVNDTRVR